MRNLTIKELHLCSFKEERSKKIPLHPKRNLILGTNDTGKSCLMKSFYYSFGAQVKFEDSWINADVKSLVTFDVDGKQYSILRDNGVFSVFDENLKHIETFTSITTGIGKFLAELLNFRLKLPSRNGDDTTPTPAFIFLPFYIDQDKGWSRSFDSFENLKQFDGYRTPTIEYHAGIRPNEYYEARLQQIKAIEERDRHSIDMKIIESMLDKHREKHKELDFDFDVESFKSEIDELLKRASSLKIQEQIYRNDLRELYDDLHFISHQSSSVERALSSTRKDFEFSVGYSDSELECPICHTLFENSFSERLEIAKDMNQFDQFRSELNNKKIKLQKDLEDQKLRLTPIQEELTKLNSILGEKKKGIQLQDIIKAEGRREFLNELKDQRNQVNEKLADFDSKLKNLEKKLKSYQDKELKKKIEDTYLLAIKNYLRELDVQNIPEAKYKKITSNIEKSGSDKPRALLAYFFSVVETVRNHSSFLSCPLVIDSPNQQAQDETNIKNILEVIRDKSPEQSQVILAVENLHEVDFNWNTIELSEKLYVLEKSSYSTSRDLFNSLISKRSLEKTS